MSLWKRIEQALFTGRVVREYGTISERCDGPANRTISALLTP